MGLPGAWQPRFGVGEDRVATEDEVLFHVAERRPVIS